MQMLLRATGLSKRFGTLQALQGLSLDIAAGEVVGLAGNSGAGKTLLMRILAGVQQPDQGQLTISGHPVTWPFQAKKYGISLIHAEPMLSDEFDIVSNIFMGHELRRHGWQQTGGILDHHRMHEEARLLLARLNVEFASLETRVSHLSSEDRQLVALAQGMAAPSVLRLIDDPAASLSIPHQNKLLDLIEAWQNEGAALFFNSQNLDHLFAVTDRIVVLRQGQIAANWRTDETNREAIVAAMVGPDDRRQRTPVIWALDSYYRARKQAETLHHNQFLLEQDLAARESINEQLVMQLAEQVRALDEANLALQDAQRRLLHEREEERKHLARELHDETIQELLGLGYQMEALATPAGENPLLLEELTDMRRNMRRLVNDLRVICGDLRPPTLDSLGLGAALTSWVRTWSERTGIEVALTLDESGGRFSEMVEISVFRIVQESLNNIWKHAGATAVQVVLHWTPRRILRITISDNGQGLPTNFDLARLAEAGHYGLLGISERVALLGGRFSWRNQEQGGLLLIVEIPHARTSSSA
jgi:signal transduction histidine kinase